MGVVLATAVPPRDGGISMAVPPRDGGLVRAMKVCLEMEVVLVLEEVVSAMKVSCKWRSLWPWRRSFRR